METTEFLPNGRMLLQDDAFFKLGQDSVLLSAFAKPRRNAKVLDLACGTGALSLLIHRPDLSITGIELQEGALALFQKSIAKNGVAIDAIQGDLRQIRSYIAPGSMDYVICNPPYFEKNSGKHAEKPAHAAARQETTCTIDDIAVACSIVLHTGGKCAIVFRPERLCVLLSAFERVHLSPKRLRFVHQTAVSSPSAVLLECRKGGSIEGLIVEPPLLIASEEYQKIYNK